MSEHYLFEVRTMLTKDATPGWELIAIDESCGLGTYVRNRLIATKDLDTALISFMIHVEKQESDRPESDAFSIPAVTGHGVLQFLSRMHDHYMGLLATGLLDVSPIVPSRLAEPESPSYEDYLESRSAGIPDTAADDLDRAMNEMYRAYKNRKDGLDDLCG